MRWGYGAIGAFVVRLLFRCLILDPEGIPPIRGRVQAVCRQLAPPACVHLVFLLYVDDE